MKCPTITFGPVCIETLQNEFPNIHSKNKRLQAYILASVKIRVVSYCTHLSEQLYMKLTSRKSIKNCVAGKNPTNFKPNYI